MSVFQISFSWKPKAEPDEFDKTSFVDWDELFVAMERFLSQYEGRFAVQFDRTKLDFDLDPDLSTIFNDLPEVLEQLRTSPSKAELYFYEQGTDIKLLLERSGDGLDIEICKGQSVGLPYANINTGPFTVPVESFLREWIRFDRAVLDMIVKLQPNLRESEVLRRRLQLLESLEFAVHP